MKRILLALLAATMVVASGTTAFAHRGHDDGGKAKERRVHARARPGIEPRGDRLRQAHALVLRLDHRPLAGDLGRRHLPRQARLRQGRAVHPLAEPARTRSASRCTRGKLYVAGGPSGAITVYDLKTKEAVATFQTGAGGFLNDLVVTKRGDVYVTDSLRPTLWHVTGDQVKAGGGTPQALDLSGGITYAAGFNLNGIVAKGSHRLVVVQTNAAKLFRIDLNDDGDAIDAIDEIEGVSLAGDGMILDRGRLVVVTGNPAQLNFVKLEDGASRAELRGTQTSDKLHGPSTVTRAKNLYLVVNADFARSASPPFTVAGLPRGRDHEDRGDDQRGDDHGDERDDDNHRGRGDDDHGGSGRR